MRLSNQEQVFKALLLQESNASRDTTGPILDPPPSRTPVGSVFRLFVVLKSSNRFSICLPILSCSFEGDAANKFNKRQHAIVYTRNPSARTKSKESALLDGNGNPEVFLIKGQKGHLHPLARIHFGELYCFRVRINTNPSKQRIFRMLIYKLDSIQPQ